MQIPEKGKTPEEIFETLKIVKSYDASWQDGRMYALGIQGKTSVFGASLGPGDAEAVLLGVPFILCIPALAVWQRFVPRLGYRKAWMAANLFFIPGLLVMIFANNFYTGLIGTVLIVPGLAGYMIMPLPMLAEIIDDDARKHGLRREGIFFGMNGGIVKAAFSMQGLLFATVLSVAGYVSGQAVQSGSAIWGIRFLIGVTPILSIIVSHWMLWKYPLGREHKSV